MLEYTINVAYRVQGAFVSSKGISGAAFGPGSVLPSSFSETRRCCSEDSGCCHSRPMSGSGELTADFGFAGKPRPLRRVGEKR